MHKLVLLRHGESDWNRENRFTGWTDVDLSSRGIEEARAGARLLRAGGYRFDLAFTSLLKRAIRTLWIALDELDQMWIPVEKSWRLNERHYGALQGKDKTQVREEFGEEQFLLWRRSYDTPPPPVDRADENHPANDSRYASLPPEVLPATECLKDVLERLLPYWADAVVPDLRAGRTVMVAAHGNSLRALVKHLDGIGDDAIVNLNVPTGIPLRYDLDDDLRPTRAVDPDYGVSGQYLDPDAARTAIAGVASQGKH